MSSEHQEMGKSHIIHPLHHSHFPRSLELFLYIIIRKLHISTLFCCCLCLVAKLCLTLCYLMDCSLPGFFVHGISQARILEYVAISFSRGSSQCRSQTQHLLLGRQILYHWVTWEALIQLGPSSVFLRDKDVENKCIDTREVEVGWIGRLGLTCIYYWYYA